MAYSTLLVLIQVRINLSISGVFHKISEKLFPKQFLFKLYYKKKPYIYNRFKINNSLINRGTSVMLSFLLLMFLNHRKHKGNSIYIF